MKGIQGNIRQVMCRRILENGYLEVYEAKSQEKSSISENVELGYIIF